MSNSCASNTDIHLCQRKKQRKKNPLVVEVTDITSSMKCKYFWKSVVLAFVVLRFSWSWKFSFNKEQNKIYKNRIGSFCLVSNQGPMGYEPTTPQLHHCDCWFLYCQYIYIYIGGLLRKNLSTRKHLLLFKVRPFAFSNRRLC